MSARSNRPSIHTEALLLGRVEYGEADLIVHLFTESHGRISAIARNARRTQKRFLGALEPFHTLKIEMSEAVRGDLYSLKASTIEVPRDQLTRQLCLLTEAGRALSWLRGAAPASVAEPRLWTTIISLLDELVAVEQVAPPEHLTAAFALRLLDILGWGMNFQSCVSCGKECPQSRPAWVSPERGGLICSTCGGGPIRLSSAVRGKLLDLVQDDPKRLDAESADAALKIAERALKSHTGHGAGQSP